jgi:hypothetical protein
VFRLQWLNSCFLLFVGCPWHILPFYFCRQSNFAVWISGIISSCSNFFSSLSSMYSLHSVLLEAVPWLKRLVAGLSPRRPGFAPGSIHVGFVVDKVALGRFSPSTSVSPANIIPPLLHIHLSPPHGVCDCSDQAAHYHNLGPQLGASLLTRHIGWKQKKKAKKNIWSVDWRLLNISSLPRDLKQHFALTNRSPIYA